MEGRDRAKPFLKWAGGKARTARALAGKAPKQYGRYWEPFMGSAAVFFEVDPEKAYLSDANLELVICFREVARDPHAVMAALDELANTRETYMAVRAQDPATLSDTDRAVRVIYLNKTGYRGLWRVNQRGQFNVPYGEYQRPYYNRDTLLRASKALAGVQVDHADFARALTAAKSSDWVYLDPPYVPDRPWGDFKRYTPEQFPSSDHARLAELMWQADARGVHLMMTNSDTPVVRSIYKGFRMRRLPTRRDIHLGSAPERASTDLVITNY